MQFKKIIAYLIVFITAGSSVLGQETGYDGIVKAITLDSVMIVAVKKGFDVNDFINLVKDDTSFYLAFKNLRRSAYFSDNQIRIYSKKNSFKASYKSTIQQSVKKDCRWMEVVSEDVEGSFNKKKGANKYYTAELFFYLFYTEDTICMTKTVATDPKPNDVSKIEKHKQQLKALIFNPGSKIEGIPLIKKKLAIFEPAMAKYYNYSITSENYRDSIPCYVFSVVKKDNLGGSKDSRIVINELHTYFSKKTFEIVKRDYNLSYFSILFDFNVTMHMKLTKIKETLIVDQISYKGFWDIPLRKPERATFNIQFYNFTTLPGE